MMQAFEWYLPAEQNFWRQVAGMAGEISNNGITSVWLPPAYKGAGGANDVGYAVYDLYDLGEFNQKGTVATKYGTKDEYLAAIQALKQNGIEVLADIVLGHRMGADETERIFAYTYDENNRNIKIAGKKKITVWTKFTFPGRQGKYSDFKWDWTNFHATDYDAVSKENAIYQFIGKQWDDEVDDELGNYDYLMGVDLDMSDEEVVEELKRWGEWYYEFTGIDGFRLDAVKHIDFGFFKNWLEFLQTKFDRDIFAVAEYWNGELPILENYIEKTAGMISLFDVPLHFNLYNASKAPEQFDLRNIMKDTLLEQNPELAVTFVDNHDTQIGQSLESYIEPWFKRHAYAFILLWGDGYPCVFYGDYYGIPHNQLAPIEHLDTLIGIRKTKAYGKRHEYLDKKKQIGWTREGEKDRSGSGVAVVMSIAEAAEKEMYVGVQFAGRKFIDAMGEVKNDVTIDEEGNGMFSCLKKSVSVWMVKEE